LKSNEYPETFLSLGVHFVLGDYGVKPCRNLISIFRVEGSRQASKASKQSRAEQARKAKSSKQPSKRSKQASRAKQSKQSK
jgi:hypothetical protein